MREGWVQCGLCRTYRGMSPFGRAMRPRRCSTPDSMTPSGTRPGNVVEIRTHEDSPRRDSRPLPADLGNPRKPPKFSIKNPFSATHPRSSRARPRHPGQGHAALRRVVFRRHKPFPAPFWFPRNPAAHFLPRFGYAKRSLFFATLDLGLYWQFVPAGLPLPFLNPAGHRGRAIPQLHRNFVYWNGLLRCFGGLCTRL